MLVLQSVVSSENFDAAAFLQSRRQTTGAFSPLKWERTCEALQAYFDELSKDNPDEYANRQHHAIIGHLGAKAYFEDKIHAFLSMYPEYATIAYPLHYPAFVEALFQEVLGFGPLSLWFDTDSEQAKVNGEAILFEKDGQMVEQPFRFAGMDRVMRLVRSIQLKDAQTHLSATEPVLDTNMLNGTRVTILMPPYVRHPTLFLRQFPMKTYTFEELARLRTIGPEAVSLFRYLARMDGLNTIITGEQRGGKTTLAKIFFEAQDPEQDTMTVETDHYEVELARDFPERASHIYEIKMPLREMQRVFPHFLRMDAKMMIPEARSDEVEFALQAAERGNSIMITYHGRDIINIPAEWARLITNLYPSRSYFAEYERAALRIHVVVTIAKADNGRKVLTGLYACDFDRNNGIFTVTPWIKYEPKQDIWTYHVNIPAQMRASVESSAYAAVRAVYPKFANELSRLADLYPMQIVEEARTNVRERVRA